MSDGPFAGATKDPIALLEQLIKQGAETRRDIAELKQGFDRLESRMDKLESRMDKLESRMAKLESRMDKLESRMDKLESRMDKLESRMDRLEAVAEETRLELKEFRHEMVRMHRAADQAYGAFKTEVSAEMERRAWVESQRVLEQAQNKWDLLERRVAELEAAERRRREQAES